MNDPQQNRQYPAVPRVGVGGIVMRDRRIALIKRGSPPSYGEWSIPGGLVDLGESLESAVSREVLEETGLTVRVERLFELVQRIIPDGDGRIRYHYIIADYLCTVTGGELIAGSDALDAGWFDEDAQDALKLAPLTARVIRSAFRELRSG
jgi:ADP-ribose pyrophosphatase YjhB (NUDIX family)